MSFDDLQGWWLSYNTLVYGLGVYGLMALSVALTLSCGVLSLASAAFMGVGAYCASLLSLHTELPFALVLLVGSLAPALLALLVGLPVLRLSGIYLAMATLGFGEVLRVITLNLEITGGALGLNGIPERTTGWHIVLALGVVLVLLHRLRESRFGRAWEAVREDEVAAAASGIDVRAVRLAAFTGSAAIAGLAGGLHAHYTFTLAAANYGFEPAVEYLTMAVLGGIAGLPGPLIGAAILTLLPELLRGLAEFRTAVSGGILIAVILFLPHGLYDPARWLRRSR
ncbi:MAG: branched-chain amino acid ABC transporter permease [Pseudomonadota bacterium]|nr:branched-chain amino acid ABC transporter permease [Pseudomonadota bacterium]